VKCLSTVLDRYSDGFTMVMICICRLLVGKRFREG